MKRQRPNAVPCSYFDSGMMRCGQHTEAWLHNDVPDIDSEGKTEAAQRCEAFYQVNLGPIHPAADGVVEDDACGIADAAPSTDAAEI